MHMSGVVRHHLDFSGFCIATGAWDYDTCAGRKETFVHGKEKA
jgi:hypothetical protein